MSVEHKFNILKKKNHDILVILVHFWGHFHDFGWFFADPDPFVSLNGSGWPKWNGSNGSWSGSETQHRTVAGPEYNLLNCCNCLVTPLGNNRPQNVAHQIVYSDVSMHFRIMLWKLKIIIIKIWIYLLLICLV